MIPIPYQDFPNGITTIDLGFIRSGFTASHLIVENGQAALVDVGPTATLPVLFEVLQKKQIPREAVRYVIVTHVHLDHAGGAGNLLRDLPNAQLVVHPNGARHVIAPQRLIDGATAVYGAETMQTLFGDVLPVPENRIIQTEHEGVLELNGRPLRFLHTAGHARHHICVVDERSQGIFTGDTFGLSYRQFDTDQGPFILPATAPVQFEPEELHASIDLLLSYRPTSLYLTHFGCVADVTRLAKDLHEWIVQLVELAQGVKTSGPERHQDLMRQVEDLLMKRLQAHGYSRAREHVLALLKTDLELDVQGLEVWLDRKQKK